MSVLVLTFGRHLFAFPPRRVSEDTCAQRCQPEGPESLVAAAPPSASGDPTSVLTPSIVCLSVLATLVGVPSKQITLRFKSAWRGQDERMTSLRGALPSARPVCLSRQPSSYHLEAEEPHGGGGSGIAARDCGPGPRLPSAKGSSHCPPCKPPVRVGAQLGCRGTQATCSHPRRLAALPHFAAAPTGPAIPQKPRAPLPLAAPLGAPPPF